MAVGYKVGKENTMHNIIKKHPVIAILRNTPPEDLGNYVQALYDGGLRAFEVSFS